MARLVLMLRVVMLVLAAGVVAGRLTGVDSWVLDAATPLAYGCVVLLLALRVWFVRTQRLVWAAFGLGLCSSIAGTVYAAVNNVADVRDSTWADVGWLGFFPFAFAGLLLLLSDRVPSRRTALDGTITGLGGAAVFSAIVLDGLIGVTTADGIVTLAYPVADAVLFGTLAAQWALGFWSGLTSTMIMGGISLSIMADTVYAATDGRVPLPAGLIDVLYLGGIMLLGLAAWRQPGPVRPDHDRDPYRVAIWLAGGALTVLLVASQTPLSEFTVILAGLTLVAGMARMGITVRELEAVGRERYREARRDALTGLANRRAVLERLDRLGRRPVALMLLDLDRFKQVNDVHGHQAGDDLLVQVAARLAEVSRAGTLVGRLGGDEFVLVVEDDDVGPEAVAAIARRVRDRLRDTYRLTGTDGPVTAGIDVSIGITIRDDANPEALLHDADLAMYQAKRAGGGHVLHMPGQPVAPALPPTARESLLDR
ncbi:GGDEF domain-containing protein [Actinoplanes couchii]|uniref:GGDEF domain-containing protein n=1 Tax=Actinoplanes couchii TaxID=403638 RepID=UPI0019449372|nr:GGDEF domain-containing protein [Actinoplanes couchii]MDR6318325.1 diguanylate cyclase (GGDEF)-like protein [Actinoplanes couchii]